LLTSYLLATVVALRIGKMMKNILYVLER